MGQEIVERSATANVATSPTTGAVRPKTERFRQLVEENKAKIQNALGRAIDADRFLAAVATATRANPQLLEADAVSLMSALMQSAQLGLMPNVLGESYLVPFRNNRKAGNPLEVQLIVGYQGYISLIRRSGFVTSIQAHEVCENDSFTFRYGLREELEHIPANGDRGEITYFYAYARFTDGGYAFEVLPKSEIDKIKSRVYGSEKSSSPWTTHYVEMGRKTMIRRLQKYLPKSTELLRAEEIERDASDNGLKIDAEFVPQNVTGAIEAPKGSPSTAELPNVAPEERETADSTVVVEPKKRGRPAKAAPTPVDAPRNSTEGFPIDEQGRTAGESVPSQVPAQDPQQVDESDQKADYDAIRRRALENAGIDPNRQTLLGFE